MDNNVLQIITVVLAHVMFQNAAVLLVLVTYVVELTALWGSTVPQELAIVDHVLSMLLMENHVLQIIHAILVIVMLQMAAALLFLVIYVMECNALKE
jgi:hypothetical protein